jgi:hypothetical protein
MEVIYPCDFFLWPQYCGIMLTLSVMIIPELVQTLLGEQADMTPQSCLSLRNEKTSL